MATSDKTVEQDRARMNHTRLVTRSFIRTSTEKFLTALAERVNFNYNDNLYVSQKGELSALESAVKATETSKLISEGGYVPIFSNASEKRIDLGFLPALYAGFLKEFCQSGTYRPERDIILDYDVRALIPLNQRINAGRAIAEWKYAENPQVRMLINDCKPANDDLIYNLLTDKTQEADVKKHAVEYCRGIGLIRDAGDEQKVITMIGKIIRCTTIVEIDHLKLTCGRQFRKF